MVNGAVKGRQNLPDPGKGCSPAVLAQHVKLASN